MPDRYFNASTEARNINQTLILWERKKNIFKVTLAKPRIVLGSLITFSINLN